MDGGTVARLRPCLECGMPSEHARCERHRGSSGWSKRPTSVPAYSAQHYRNRARLLRSVGADSSGIGGTCALCGRPGVVGNPLTADHITPRRLGGSDDLGNLRAVHRNENARMGASLAGRITAARRRR